MTMVKRQPHAWPSPYRWMPVADTPDAQLRLAILERARMDWCILEEKPNRGPEIDVYLRRAHVPESLISAGKGNWCGAIVGAWWVDAGSRVPGDYANCDKWLPYLVPCTRDELATVGRAGDAVLFGVPGDARHIEVLVRTAPYVLSTGGNRGLSGLNTNNGVAMHTDRVTRNDVLGVVRPERAT